MSMICSFRKLYDEDEDLIEYENNGAITQLG